MNSPSEEQLRAIESESRLLSIVACAGSGKTFTLTRKIAYTIDNNGINPENIAAITFTTLAANQLQHSISSLVSDKTAPTKMFIGTIHSFCFNVMKEYFREDYINLKPITQLQQYALLNRYWNEWGIEEKLEKEIKHRNRIISSLLTTFDVIKSNLLSSNMILKNHPGIYSIMYKYQEYLENNNFIDFPDMIVKFYNNLKSNTKFREFVLNKYKYLFIDEYQDVDFVQAKIVDFFVVKNYVCIVGDDDQAIYQFRGTDERNLLNFTKKNGCETIVLNENRRCPNNIVLAAKNIIRKCDIRIEKNMHSSKKSGNLKCSTFASVDEEIHFIIKEIKNLVSKGVSYNQIAILMRSVSSYGKQYISELRKNDIPVISRGGGDYFDQIEIKTLILLLEWVSIDDEEKSLSTLALCDYTINDFVEYYNINKSVLEQIKSNYHEQKFHTILELIHSILEKLEIFDSDISEIEKFNLAYMTKIVKDYEDIIDNNYLSQFINHIKYYASDQYDQVLTEEISLNAVSIMTVHQAKGLEFDYVFLPMLVEKRFPIENTQKKWLINSNLFESKKYLSTIDNERKLFYVACTRAKNSLHLLASRDVHGKKDRNPSLFFLELENDPNCLDVDSIVKNPEQIEEVLYIGYSSLEYYLTCPYRYKLLNVYGIQFPQIVFFQFGKLVHDVLAQINISYINKINMTEEDAMKYFTLNFEKYYRNTKLREYDIRKQMLRGKQIITKYYSSQYLTDNRIIDVEKPFAYFTEKATIRGRFDLLMENSKNERTIIDYKTGIKHSNLNPDFQIKFYALASNRQMNLNVSHAELLYLEEFNKYEYEINDQFIDEGETLVQSLLEGIVKRKFPPNPSKGVCSNCEAKKLCKYQF